MFHVSCINQTYKFFKRPTDAIGFVNVILLHSYQRHVSATHVISTHYNCICILVLIALRWPYKWPKRVADYYVITLQSKIPVNVSKNIKT